jgi:TetR/AcrR family transcriptional repressor of nem operon
MSSADQAPAGPLLTNKGRATRARIVAAAAAQMFERGVARTSLEDVKASAGVSSSQLYHYFADKQALVLAVIDHQTGAILDGQEPLLSHLDSLEALRAWRDLLVGIQRSLNCEGGCPIGSIGGEMAETDPEARARVARGFGEWEQSIRAGLRDMHGRGELVGDPDGLALALLAAVQGGLLLTQVQRDVKPLEVVLDTMIEHIGSQMALPPEHG